MVVAVLKVACRIRVGIYDDVKKLNRSMRAQIRRLNFILQRHLASPTSLPGTPTPIWQERRQRSDSIKHRWLVLDVTRNKEVVLEHQCILSK